jgi:hypothetical protein
MNYHISRDTPTKHACACPEQAHVMRAIEPQSEFDVDGEQTS